MPAPTRLMLQAMSALCVSGCFTLVDFELGENAGGSGAGGLSSAGGMAGAAGAVGGAGGEPLGGRPPDCNGCAPEDCAEGVCQAVLVHTAASTIAVLAAADTTVALMEEGQKSPLIFLDATTGAMTGTTSKAALEPWDSAGTLAVTQDGVGFYSPQSANSDTPVQRCDPARSVCEVAFDTVGNSSHLNGMTFFESDSLGGLVYGVAPTGVVWSAGPEALSAGIAFEVNVPSTDDVAAAHGLAFRGNRVMASSLGSTGLPCIGADESGQLLDPNDGDSVICEPLPKDYLRVSGLAISADDRMFMRAVGNPLSAVVLELDPRGNFVPRYPGMPYAVGALDDANGKVATDQLYTYFFADLAGKRLVRCDVDDDESCKPASSAMPTLGQMVENSDAVFFTVGNKLYRVAKATPAP